ncbi:MAG: hypothetical protein J5988_10125 [Eubacterium sp.]|nr:hypothetical protein [Eubacterium sp.]
MKITITMTQESTGKSCDIQVSDTQKIEDTIQVIKENLGVFQKLGNISYVRDADSGRKIDVESTYEQTHICSGAKLLLP